MRPLVVKLLDPDVYLSDGGAMMDLNVMAFRTTQEAIREDSSVPENRKTAARKGGLIGGPSRARSMGTERRAEIA